MCACVCVCVCVCVGGWVASETSGKSLCLATPVGRVGVQRCV